MFAKVFRSLWQGSMMGRSDEQLVFIFLLAWAGSDGVVEVTQEYISALTGLSLHEVEAALQALLGPDPRSRTDEAGGARIEPLDGRGWGWRIVNYSKYRSIRDEEERKRQTKEATARWRARVSHGEPPRAQEEGEGEAEGEEVSQKPAASPRLENKPDLRDLLPGGIIPPFIDESSMFKESDAVVFRNREAIKGAVLGLAKKKSDKVPKTKFVPVGEDTIKGISEMCFEQDQSVLREAIKLGSWLVKTGNVRDERVVLGVVSHWLAHRDAVKNPYQYYAKDSDGLLFVERKVRLGIVDAEHEADKKAEKAELA